MIQEGNLWEAAHDLARQWFAAADYPVNPPGFAPGQQEAGAGPQAPPRIRIDAGWWRRRQLYQLVVRLWGLASSATPRRVSPQEFSRLVEELESLMASLADGTLHLEGAKEKA